MNVSSNVVGPSSFRTVQGFKEWAFYRHGVRMGTDLGVKYGEFKYGILAITFDDVTGRIVEAYAHCEHMSHGLGNGNTLKVLCNMVTKGRPA